MAVTVTPPRLLATRTIAIDSLSQCRLTKKAAAPAQTRHKMSRTNLPKRAATRQQAQWRCQRQQVITAEPCASVNSRQYAASRVTGRGALCQKGASARGTMASRSTSANATPQEMAIPEARLGLRRILRGRWISHGGPNSAIAVGGGATEGSKHGSLLARLGLSAGPTTRAMAFVKNTHRQQSRVAGTCLYGRLW
ncbi:hypothetical protein MTO96_026837 [Rhipicephalus appendiculatus]